MNNFTIFRSSGWVLYTLKVNSQFIQNFLEIFETVPYHIKILNTLWHKRLLFSQ